MSRLIIDPFSRSRWTTVSSKGIISDIHSFTKTLANSIEPLLFHLKDLPETPLSRFGTSFKLRVLDRYFLVCTEHQFLDADPTSVVIISERNQKAITSHQTYFAMPNKDGEMEVDLRVFEFTQPVKCRELPSVGWWDGGDTIDEDHETFELMVAVGYPSFNNGIDYQVSNLSLAPRGIFGRRIGPTFGRLHGIAVEKPLFYDPDGLSGSPVFALAESLNGFTAKFAGIVSNAGKSQINYWPASALSQMILFALKSKFLDK